MPHPTVGLTTGTKLVESNTNVLHSVSQFRPFLAGTYGTSPAYTPAVFSLYVQQSTRRYVAIRLRADSGGANGATATFDTQTGAFTYQANDGTGATRTVGFVDAGSSWWRIWIAVTGLTPSVGWEATAFVCNASGAPAAYTGDGASGVFVMFPQLEAGTAPTDYLGTTSVAIDERFAVAGSYSWTVTATNEFGSASQAYTQTVDSSTGPRATIDSPVVVKTGSTTTVTVRAVTREGFPLSGATIALSSGSTGVATVSGSPQTSDAAGVATFTLTGVSAGSSTLTATVNSTQATATTSAAVSANTVASLAFSTIAPLTVGGLTSVLVTAIGDNGLPVGGVPVTLSSGTTSVATVASSPQTTNGSGIASFSVTGVAAGSSTLTATAVSGAITQTASVFVSLSSVGTIEAQSAWGKWLRGR